MSQLFQILICQVIPAEAVQALLGACKSGNFDSANKEVNNLIAEGYPVAQMLTQVSFLPLLLQNHLFNNCGLLMQFFTFSYLMQLLKQMIYQMNRRQEYARNWVKLIRLQNDLFDALPF